MNALEGKIAIVTGASRGIGAGIAKEFAAQGASVVVNYVTDKAGADAVVEHITSNGANAIAVQADVSNKDDVERLFQTAIAEYGKLDVLVNNAAVFVFEPIEQVDETGFLRHFTNNVLSDILTTQQAIKYFGGRAAASSTSPPRAPRTRRCTRPCTHRPRARSTRSPLNWPGNSGLAASASMRSHPARP